MIKADSDRLLKALLISIMFHVFMFFAMNLLDWFPEIDIPERLAPVTIRIEKESRASVASMEEEIEPVSTEIPEQDKSTPIKPEPITSAVSDTDKASVPVEAQFDPYADLGISDNSISPLTVPIQDEQIETRTDYVPTGGNVIKLEEADPLVSGEVVSSEIVDETQETLIVPGEVIGELEAALANKGEQSNFISPDPSDKDRDLYNYNEFPIEFNSPGVIRKLVSEPTINIPSDILKNISSERTIIIGFSLDANGLLHRLNIKRSSGYTPLDISIMSEIRMWKFDTDSGSEDVEGTVTIILKGR